MKKSGNIGDYLQKRAEELGLGRADQLSEIQAHLDSLYPGQCRAVSLHDGVLKITTPNASLASELRLNQYPIVQAIEQRTKIVVKLHINIA